ncbi:MAG: Sec-independent protein translocase protein TatB [Oceanicoccus sp.]
MFDIGFQELLLIGVISLLIMGPERLPGAIRTSSLWIARLRRSFQQIKSEIEREVGADEIRQQIHNESIMKDLEKTKDAIQDQIQLVTDDIKPNFEHLPHDTNNSDTNNDTNNNLDNSNGDNADSESVIAPENKP